MGRKSGRRWWFDMPTFLRQLLRQSLTYGYELSKPEETGPIHLFQEPLGVSRSLLGSERAGANGAKGKDSRTQVGQRTIGRGSTSRLARKRKDGRLARAMTRTTLEAQLTSLTLEFVGRLVEVIRNASFADVAALSPHGTLPRG